MELRKSHWEADANRVSLAMPISKIDKENRLVSGFATLDNVDTSDDVVTAEASKAAFSAFRGNIREMHQPIAAGRLVDFKEEEFFHDGEFYRGIYATAYVSKGAQDTWEKVLDGTLSGFSIGGNIVQQETKFVKDAGSNGKTVRYIEKYDLTELSLVDNPANQLANVFSIVKNQQGDTMMKGMVTETRLVNVFWCGEDEIAKNSTQESETCLSCGNKMNQIGWFEQGEDNAVKTAAAVATFLRNKEAGTDKAEAISEGGVQMANENEEKKDEGVVTSGDTTDEAKDETKTDENGESLKSDQATEDEPSTLAPDEVTEQDPTSARAPETPEKDAEALREAEELHEASPEPNFEKMFDDLKGAVNDSLAKTVEKVEAHVDSLTKSFDEKTSKLESGLSELSKSLESVKAEREGVAKRLDALEKMTAIKKSGEVETEPEKKMQKGLWAGTFFNADA